MAAFAAHVAEMLTIEGSKIDSSRTARRHQNSLFSRGKRGKARHLPSPFHSLSMKLTRGSAAAGTWLGEDSGLSREVVAGLSGLSSLEPALGRIAF